MLAAAVTGVALLVVGIVWVSSFIDKQIRDQGAARLRHLAGSSADGIIIEQGGKIIEINAAFERVSGFTRDELIGHAVGTAGFAPRNARRRHHRARNVDVPSGESIAVEIAARAEDGKPGEAGLRVCASRHPPRLAQERKLAELARIDTLDGPAEPDGLWREPRSRRSRLPATRAAWR